MGTPEIFHFNEVQFIIIYFTNHVFGIISKKTSPRPSRIFPKLSSESFIVLQFTIRFMTHLDFFMKCGVRSVSRFIFACGYLLVPAPFVEDTISVPQCYLWSFVKDPLTLFMEFYFWALCSVPLIYLYICSLIPHCFDYHSSILNLEVR